jgi:hypothetical protein
MVFKHVERDKFLGINALETQDLNAGARKTALRRFGSALHEENDGRGGNCLINCCLGFRGQEARMKDRGKRKGRGANGTQEWPRDRAESLESVSIIGWREAGWRTENVVRENMISARVVMLKERVRDSKGC